MTLAVEQKRKRLVDLAQALLQVDVPASLQTALQKWLTGKDDADASKTAAAAVQAELAKALPQSTGETAAMLQEMISLEGYLAKKSMWIFGGDGWAYDIGFGGLDHVLASGANVNVLVLDTEVYSNTGGQSSKATPTGAVANLPHPARRHARRI